MLVSTMFKVATCYQYKKKLTQVEIISYLVHYFGQRPLGNRYFKKKKVKVISLYTVGPSNSYEYLLGKRLIILIYNLR